MYAKKNIRRAPSTTRRVSFQRKVTRPTRPVSNTVLFRRAGVRRTHARSHHARRYTRRRTRSFNSAKFPKTQALIPDRLLTTLNFVSGEIIAGVTTANVIQWYAFSSAGIFRPQLTQPSGTAYAPANSSISACTDEAMGDGVYELFYNQYMVHKVEVRIEGQSGNIGTSAEPIYCFVGTDYEIANNHQPAIDNVRSVLMDRDYKHFTIEPTVPIKFRRSYKPYELLGVSKKDYSTDNNSYSGYVGTSNPQANATIWVGFCKQNLAGTATGQVNARVFLKYYVEYFQPKYQTATTKVLTNIPPPPPSSTPVEESSSSDSDDEQPIDLSKSDMVKLKAILKK